MSALSLSQTPTLRPFPAAAARYEIKEAVAVPTAMLHAGYEHLFPQRAAFFQAHWRWLYRVNAYDWSHAPLVAVAADGQVIGHMGVIPITLRRGGAERRAAWLVDMAVSAKYHRQGIGLALTKAATARHPLMVAFGNEHSTAALLKGGWHTNGHTRSFQLLLRPEHHPKFQASRALMGKALGLTTRTIWRLRSLATSKVRVTNLTAADLAEFAEDEPVAPLHVTRSLEFLHWRLLAHPRVGEHLVIRDDRGCSAIARLNQEDGFQRLHLLMVRADGKGRLASFLAGVVQWALAESLHQVLLVTSQPHVAEVTKWWLPLTSRLRYLCHSADTAGWDFVDGTDHLWECIDNDFDLS